MAPKKEKVEKVSASAQEDMVFEYLRKQKCVMTLQHQIETALLTCDALSRPYSVRQLQVSSVNTRPYTSQATDISANLHNKVTKSEPAL